MPGFTSRWKSVALQSDERATKRASNKRQQLSGRVRRLIKIYEEFHSHAPLTVQVLAIKFGVSERTIYRDLSTLIESGVPIEFQSSLSGYVLTAKRGRCAPLWTDGQARALALSVAGCRIPSRRSQSAAVEALAIFIENCSTNQRHMISRLAEACRLPIPNVKCDPRLSEAFDRVVDAIMQGSDLLLSYVDRSSQTVESTRLSAPYKLLFDESEWRIGGASSFHRAWRSFSFTSLANVLAAERLDRD